MVMKKSWSETSLSEAYKGMWVALDNCRYDAKTRRPTAGDVVDSDFDLSELCARMRARGLGSCAIFFCDQQVLVETQPCETG